MTDSSDKRLVVAPSTFAPSMLTLRIGLCLVAMWAIFGLILCETRWHTWNDAKIFGADVATLVEATITREFELYDLSISALAEDSLNISITALPDFLRNKAPFNNSAGASDLGRLFVLDRDGRVIHSSGDQNEIGLDLSYREYFQAERESADNAFHVTGPFIGRVTHIPSIAISQRRASSDGRFAGIAVGTIRLSFFDKIFDSVHLPNGSTITLLKQDGTILTRCPFHAGSIGMKIMDDTLAAALTRKAGVFHRIARSDGIERLFAFRRFGTLPLYVTVGFSTREIFANWRWEVTLIATGFAILTAIILLLGLNLSGELRRRNEAERRLAELASTDYLTLLANRRRFDAVLGAEWRRGARASSPLSLLMVDGDYFKSFNDTYGHLEGDRVLRVIATALKTCVDRAGDLVARYGGEEFAVLLPATTSEGALIVATAIRTSIDALDLAHAPAPSGRLTVSIGVACRTPNAALAPETLVEAADAALYIAKAEGRDRIVLEGPATSQVAEDQRKSA